MEIDEVDWLLLRNTEGEMLGSHVSGERGGFERYTLPVSRQLTTRTGCSRTW